MKTLHLKHPVGVDLLSSDTVTVVAFHDETEMNSAYEKLPPAWQPYAERRRSSTDVIFPFWIVCHGFDQVIARQWVAALDLPANKQVRLVNYRQGVVNQSQPYARDVDVFDVNWSDW